MELDNFFSFLHLLCPLSFSSFLSFCLHCAPFSSSSICWPFFFLLVYLFLFLSFSSPQLIFHSSSLRDDLLFRVLLFHLFTAHFHFSFMFFFLFFSFHQHIFRFFFLPRVFIISLSAISFFNYTFFLLVYGFLFVFFSPPQHFFPSSFSRFYLLFRYFCFINLLNIFIFRFFSLLFLSSTLLSLFFPQIICCFIISALFIYFHFLFIYFLSYSSLQQVFHSYSNRFCLLFHYFFFIYLLHIFPCHLSFFFPFFLFTFFFFYYSSL